LSYGKGKEELLKQEYENFQHYLCGDKYFYLRRYLALKKAYKAIKKIKHKERRIVDDLSHKISRAIVNEAVENGSMRVLGKLKGIRRDSKRRRFNRKLNNVFPYYKLSQFIKYKAKWLRIKVIKVSERNISKTCHRCGYVGLRVGSLFKCPDCNYPCNADYNGAMSILMRAMGV